MYNDDDLENPSRYLITEDGVIDLSVTYDAPLSEVFQNRFIDRVGEITARQVHRSAEEYGLDAGTHFAFDATVEFDDAPDGSGMVLLTLKDIPEGWLPVWENKDGLFDPNVFATELGQATTDVVADARQQAAGGYAVLLQHEVRIFFNHDGGVQIMVTNLPPLESWLFPESAAA